MAELQARGSAGPEEPVRGRESLSADALMNTLDSCVVREMKEESKQRLPLESLKKINFSHYVEGALRKTNTIGPGGCGGSIHLKLNPGAAYVQQPREAESPVMASRCSIDPRCSLDGMGTPALCERRDEAFSYDLRSYRTEPPKTMSSCGKGKGKKPR